MGDFRAKPRRSSPLFSFVWFVSYYIILNCELLTLLHPYLLEILLCGKTIFMAWSTRKKLSRLVLAAYIALSAAGVFSLMAVEVLRAVCFEVRGAEPDRIYNTENGYFIRQPAESTALVFKTGTAYFTLLHTGFQRIAPSSDLQIIQNIFSKQSLTANAKVQYIKLKNTISLNLRI
jgi:hypothetical protein